MISTKCFSVLTVTLVILEIVWSQDDTCTNPIGETGVCVNVRRCPFFVSLLQSSPRPLPQSVRQQLLQAQCGFEGRDTLVCCVRNSTTSANPIGGGAPPVTNPQPSGYREPPPSVEGHRNLALLPTDCGLSDQDRLLGGNKTGVLEFPWMALISYDTSRGRSFRCGGTIINDKYILTAAHCITNLDGDTLAGVRVGEHDVSTEQDCIGPSSRRECFTVQEFLIEQVIPHSRFVGNQRGRNPLLQHDIGLLRLSGTIDMEKSNVLAVCLPITRGLQEVDLENKNVTVTGWGATETGPSSSDLLKISIPTVPNTRCGEALNSSVQDGVGFRQVCAGGIRGIDSCGGDSGGPLYLEGQLNGASRFIQQGIVSFGPRRCGQLNIPGVYTRVAYYVDWILDQLRP